jgi:hypothetical protein
MTRKKVHHRWKNENKTFFSWKNTFFFGMEIEKNESRTQEISRPHIFQDVSKI